MKKILLLTIMSILLVTLAMQPVSAYFTKSHLYWSLKGFDEVNSPITDMCRDRIAVVLDGNTAADIAVLHYFENKDGVNFMSYISTHTRGSGYNACLEWAGQDVDLQCFCYGIALHNVQDHFSHEAMTPKYLKKYFSSNFIGHMTIESDFENKHIKMLEDDSVVSSGRLDSYNQIVLDTLFEDEKYLSHMKLVTGIDIRNDANIFANGYKGKGFYGTVYGQKLSLPLWFWGVSITLILVGFFVPLLLLFLRIKGVANNWIFLLMAMYLIFLVIGAIVLISLATNTSWQVIRGAVMLLPIRVSNADVSNYNNMILDATKQFLTTGELPYDDSSGLSYRTRSGEWREGYLNEAEGPFKYVMMPLLIIVFISINLGLIYLSFRKSSKRRK